MAAAIHAAACTIMSRAVSLLPWRASRTVEAEELFRKLVAIVDPETQRYGTIALLRTDRAVIVAIKRGDHELIDRQKQEARENGWLVASYPGMEWHAEAKCLAKAIELGAIPLEMFVS
jgi:hypothetical protein